MHFIYDILIFFSNLFEILQRSMIIQNILRVDRFSIQNFWLSLSMNMSLFKCLWWRWGFSLMEKLLLVKIIVIVFKIIIIWNSRTLASLILKNSTDSSKFDVVLSRMLLFDAECFSIHRLINEPSIWIIYLLFDTGVTDVWIVKAAECTIVMS